MHTRRPLNTHSTFVNLKSSAGIQLGTVRLCAKWACIYVQFSTVSDLLYCAHRRRTTVQNSLPVDMNGHIWCSRAQYCHHHHSPRNARLITLTAIARNLQHNRHTMGPAQQVRMLSYASKSTAKNSSFAWKLKARGLQLTFLCCLGCMNPW